MQFKKSQLMVNSESSTQSIISMANIRPNAEELNSPSVQEVSFFGSLYQENCVSHAERNRERYDISDKSCNCKLF